MVEIKIEISSDTISSFNELMGHSGSGLLGAAMPNTAAAFLKAQHTVAKAWRDYLQGETQLNGIEPLEKVNKSMISSIKERSYGDFDKSVYSNSKELEEIIKGSPDVDYDMKKTHPYGKQSRVSKKGIPYLIIPFRWGTPNGKGTKRRWNNSIPQASYNNILKGFEISSTTGLTHPEPNAKGQAIDRPEYNWESRLSADEAWDDRSVGMVRMKDINESTYFTFRIISAKSPKNSWLYHRDGKPAVDIMAALDRTLREPITKMIESAISADEALLH